MTNNAPYYLGLMSGTSADGLDMALLDFSQQKTQVVASGYLAYPTKLQQQILALYQPDTNEIDRFASLDIELALFFAEAVKQFLADSQIETNQVQAIGNHGQTIRHRPNNAFPFTIQIGCDQTLAIHTGIRVIGQFRQKDMALGGQGAPLAPIFHQQLFCDAQQDVAVINLGGIANLTYLPAAANKSIIGFDIGPANALLDAWFQLHHPQSPIHYDQHGKWANSGQVILPLLQAMLAEPYFKAPAPKSTGREYFNLAWLKQFDINSHKPADIQATLLQLTVSTLKQAIVNTMPKGKVVIMGGGAHNISLKNKLNQTLSNYEFIHSFQNGITEDNLEAALFAWLAFAYDKKIYGNIPTVTGAREKTVLGVEFCPK